MSKLENQSQQLEVNADGFEKGLNPITNRYLNSKFQRLSNSDSLDKIDLRHMCENVYNISISYLFIYVLNRLSPSYKH